MKTKKGLRVGLALGGGAARGLAHIGVLQVLEEKEVPIHALAGVSVGSIIAAAYAAGLSLDTIVEAARTVTWRDLGSWSFSVRGFNRNDRMERWLSKMMPVETFEELRIPLRIVATDLHSGKPVVLEKGALFPAIRASCAIPGLYVPVELNGYLLADGYLVTNLPVREAKGMGVDVVLASAIGLEVSSNVKLNNIYQIIMRSFSIMSAAVQRSSYQDADVVFHPKVESFSWAEIESAPQLLEAGRESVLERLSELEDTLNPTLLNRFNWNPWRRVQE